VKTHLGRSRRVCNLLVMTRPERLRQKWARLCFEFGGVQGAVMQRKLLLVQRDFLALCEQWEFVVLEREQKVVRQEFGG
jgi:hypothetical protein